MAYIIDGAFNIPYDLITIKDLLKNLIWNYYCLKKF